mmetsp:Transcript_6882/g.12625  ORF Transcript_6882/g.12625 Transcript_6882/m.12625 type:complete len:210 (-) Transcript_6882:813-1442(-)
MPFPFWKTVSITSNSPGDLSQALISSVSASSTILSTSSSIPFFVFAEMSTDITGPPNSSTTTPAFISSPLTLSGSAPSTSHLLMATSIGTWFSWAMRIDSTVWSCTPSVALTMITATSVAPQPLARIDLKIEWPGVSSTQSSTSPDFTRNAPRLCVMPPASFSTTFVDRSASSSEVFPWLTWPMMHTTGGFGGRCERSSGGSVGKRSLK